MSRNQNQEQVGGLISYNQGVLIQGNNITTGRDVNISNYPRSPALDEANVCLLQDVTASLARSLYRSFVSSCDSFQPLVNDISSIVAALDVAKGSILEIRANEAFGRQFEAILTGCHAILEPLNELLLRYTGLPSTERETWARSAPVSNEVATLKEDLDRNVRQLILFNTTQNNVTTNKINDALQLLIGQLRAKSQKHALPHIQDRQSMNDDAHLAISEIDTSASTGQATCDQDEDPISREGSIPSMYTAESMTCDEKENWRQLRKALQGVGIAPQLFDHRQGFIVSRIRELIEGGALEEAEALSTEPSKPQPKQEFKPEQTTSAQDCETFTSRSSIRTFYTCVDGNEQSSPELPPGPTTKSLRRRPKLSDQILMSLGYYRQDKLLLAAVEAGDISRVETCLRRGANLHGDPYKGSPLMLAAYCGNEAIVHLLLDYGADIEVKNKFDETALIVAARSGREGVVQLLLERGADIEAKNIFKETALMVAATVNHLGMVNLLLERGADIEAKNGYDETSLIIAARAGHEGVVQLLLDQRADIEAKNKFQETALIVAAKFNHLGMANLLLERGADIKARDIFVETALMKSARDGYEAVVRLLLEWRADIEAKDFWDWTALTLAAARGHQGVVRLLLERGAYIEARDNQGCTPLMRAVENVNHERSKVVALLLGHGANIESRDGHGNTPFDHAKKNDELGSKQTNVNGADEEHQDESPLASDTYQGQSSMSLILPERDSWFLPAVLTHYDQQHDQHEA